MGKKNRLDNYMWLVALFVTIDLSDLGMKFLKRLVMNLTLFFLVIVFGAALLTALIINIAKRTKVEFRFLLWGLLLGIPNLLTSLFFLKV